MLLVQVLLGVKGDRKNYGDIVLSLQFRAFLTCSSTQNVQF